MKIIIAGAGRVGKYLVERLSPEGHDIVVIDQKSKILDSLTSQFDISVVKGSSSSIETLKTAGVEQADIIIAATDSDEVNLLTGVVADNLNQKAHKVARIKSLSSDESNIPSNISLIFDRFINPSFEAAAYLIRLLEVPGASEVHDFASGRVRVVAISLSDEAPIVGKKLREMAAGNILRNMLVVAIAREGEIIVPRGEDEIHAGDLLYIATEPGRTEDLFTSLGLAQKEVKSVMISGAGRLSSILARMLVEKDVKVKVIEEDAELSERLAHEVSDALVLNGSPTDQDLLKHEGVAEVDAFIGASSNDEDNILTALLAKKLGASTVGAVVNTLSYLSFVGKIGIDLVASTNIATASSILKFVRRGLVSSVFSIRDGSAEVIEIIATRGSKIVARPLKELKLPQGVLVAAVVNDESVSIATGETVIEENDRVIIFSLRESLVKLEKLLDVKVTVF